MHPYVFDHVNAYAVFIAAGVGVGIAIGVRRLRIAGLDLRRCIWLELPLAAAGLIGAKVYAMVERGHVLPVFDEVTGSLRYPGGILAAAVVLVAFRKSLLRGVSLGALADAVAPATGLAVAVARLGCFAFGCCFGVETALFWGVQFPAQSPAWHAHVAARSIVSAAPLSLAVHPLQLYFAASSAGIAWFVAWYAQRATYAGQAALVFVALDGFTKTLLEILRGEPRLNLQIAALAAALLATGVLVFAAWRARRVEPDALPISERTSEPSPPGVLR